MAQVSIQEQVSKLLELQDIDFKIYKLSQEKEEKPAFLKELEGVFQENKAKLSQLEADRKSLILKRKEKEGQLSQKEEEAKKLEAQLMQIKTNKEYAAMQKEITGVKADNSLIEDEIIFLLDEVDKKDKEVGVGKKHLQEEDIRFNSEKKSVEERLKEIEAQIYDLQAKRKQVTPSVDKRILSQYERILHNREGRAIVPVKNDSCGGCFINLPPQVINEIKMMQNLVFCESCARILYIDNE